MLPAADDEMVVQRDPLKTSKLFKRHVLKTFVYF